MVSYAMYRTGASPQEGRDATGKWMRMKRPDEVNAQRTLSI